MNTKLVNLFPLLVAISFFALGCQEKPKTEAPPPPPATQMESPSPHGMAAGEARITELPDSVKDKWTAVKLEVMYKEKNEKKEFEVPLNSEFTVPDTDIVIAVGHFFPEFSLQGNTYTSVSNELKNPATNVEIKQNDSLIFKGWLFSNFPDVHPFENEKYGVRLVSGIPAQ